MEYGDLFCSEINVINNARMALDKGWIAGGASAKEFQWLLEKYIKLFNQTRRLIKFSDRMQDELNRLNRKLFRSEAKYRNIFENAAEGIFRSDPSGKLMEVNPAMVRIMGCASVKQALNRAQNPRALETQDGYRKLLAIVRRRGKCLQYQTELIRMNGETIWVEMSAQAYSDETGAVTHIDGLLSDITERKNLQEELTRKAHTDDLTGVYNRRYFKERLQKEICKARRSENPLSLIMIDVDFFKSINDRFGHDSGDKALQRITTVCREALRGDDIFGRLGGEEFAVILPNLTLYKAKQVAERLRMMVESERIRAGRSTIRITVSIGLCQFGGEITESEALLKAADEALYEAKQKGRNQVCLHRG
jgi:diguanylate cyclase (GGDEF)-like protein/PAS domain S-box-containing protein